MNVQIFPTENAANDAAADFLAQSLPKVRNLMLATGNTPLRLYELIASKGLSLSDLTLFAMDEYGGVPTDEPRNSANQLRDRVVKTWGLKQFHFLPPNADDAAIQKYEALIQSSGGLDLIVLGLGRNGHLAFNEPGSARTCPGRVVPLQSSSVQANREWFGGQFAPDHGVTTGLKIILSARRAVILAYGAHKAHAVRAMLEGPVDSQCPASFLREHPDAHAFLDSSAAVSLRR